MDRNLFLAVTASIAVYAVWFGYVEKKIAKQYPAPVAVSSSAVAGAGAAAPSSASGGAARSSGSSAARTASSPAPASAAAAVPAASDRAEAFHFANADIVVRAHGAAIASWKFTGPRGVVQLVKDPDPGFLSSFPDLAFSHIGKPEEPAFAATRPDRLRVVKEFLPGSDEGGKPTPPRLRFTFENPTGKPLDTGAWSVSVGPGLGTVETEEKDNDKVSRSLAFEAGEGGLKGKVEVFKNPGEHGADYRWAGIDNRYFLAAMLPRAGQWESVTAKDKHLVSLTAKSVTVPAKGSATVELPFYVGAKGQTWLSRYKLDLERSIDFGFFSQLGRIVLRVLGEIHKATGNWGWSIIILTVLIQMLMFPATYQSLKATAKMKVIQPEIAKLQQKYSKDPQRLNQEMMALYKKHGANPLGGCLPMLVQLPIFYALYTALRNAWELHGASWIWWIHDLSSKDPYYVLPLIMGGIMFAQNKMSPAAGADPTQQQMMTFMPIIFTVMFLKFPSGLVLYYLTNSLVTVLVQLALREKLGLAPKKA